MVSVSFYLCPTPMIIVEILFYVSLTYHLWITFSRSFLIHKHEKNESSMKEKVGFSLIICAHNELDNLKENIPFILQQDHPIFELIVVLDRCTDESFEFLESIYKDDDRLRVISINKVPEAFSPKKYGLTKAIEFANHDWLLFTDADCKPISNQWVSTFSEKTFPQTDIILGVSPYKNEHGFLSQIINYETFQTAYSYIASAIQKTPYMGVGRNLAYRKTLFVNQNGFEPFEGITGGDDDLFVQLAANGSNTIVNLDHLSQTISAPKRTRKEYFLQKTRHFSVGKYYQPKVKSRLTLISFAHLMMWLSFIFLISFKPDTLIIGSIFAVALIVKGTISNYTSSNLQIKWNLWLIPLLDLVYAIFLPLVSLRSFLIKRVKWN